MLAPVPSLAARPISDAFGVRGPSVRCALLACALGVGAGGCGLVDRSRERLEAFLSDEAGSATTSGAQAVPAEPVVVARAGEEAGSSGEVPSDGATSDGKAGSSGEASDGGSGGPERADAGDTTGLLPMSYARPPDAPVATPTTPTTTPPAAPAPTTPEPAGGSTPPTPGPPCLEGEWDAEDLHSWFRRDIAKQAHGRTLRFRGETGRHRLRFEPGVLHGEAEHRRTGFDARLANVDIRYTVDVHGSFEAPFRSESPDVLVVDRPVRSTLRVREVVRFSAEKSETRTLALPVEGRWQVTCGPGSLELRLLEDGKPGPALRFVRPKP